MKITSYTEANWDFSVCKNTAIYHLLNISQYSLNAQVV